MENGNKDWLWLLGGVGVVAVIGGIIYYTSKRKKEASANSNNPASSSNKKGGKNPAPATINTKQEGTTDPFDPGYWKDMAGSVGGKVQILKAASSNALSKQIYEAEGVVNDDEDSVYKVFSGLKSKVQVSYLAEQFQKIYKTDLRDYLKGFLDEEEMEKVNRIVALLPAYT